jgi:hypothetical protein
VDTLFQHATSLGAGDSLLPATLLSLEESPYWRRKIRKGIFFLNPASKWATNGEARELAPVVIWKAEATTMSGDERSLSELKRDAEKNRADLTITVDQLRTRVSDTVDDIRERISPESMKAAAGDYFRSRGEQLMEKVRENPLQAAAIGVGLSYPLMRMVRSIPAPVLMVGAGLFLMGTTSGKNVSRKIADTAGDVADRIGDGADTLNRSTHDARESVSRGVALAKDTVAAGVNKLIRQTTTAGSAIAEGSSQLTERGAALLSSASDSVAAVAKKADTAPDLAGGAIRDGASAAGEFAQDAAGAAADFGVHSALRIRSGAIQASQRAGEVIGEIIQQNPLLVGSIGLAVGALIASALPRSDIEKGLMGAASADVQKLATEAASQGFEAAKDIATGVITDVAHKAEEQGLTADGLADAARDIGRRARHVAENATTTAFELASDKAAMSPKRGSLL